MPANHQSFGDQGIAGSQAQGVNPCRDTRLLHLQQRFLEELRKAALAANATGTKPSDAAATLRFPEELQPWVGPSLARQLTQVCAALK